MAKKEEKKLSAWQRFLLWFHLLHCGMCRRFKTQLDRITRGVKGWIPRETLNADEKEMLKNSISKNL